MSLGQGLRSPVLDGKGLQRRELEPETRPNSATLQGAPLKPRLQEEALTTPALAHRRNGF